MNLLDGYQFVREKYPQLASRIKKLSFKPKLIIILVGNKQDSLLYTNIKMKKCEKIGLLVERIIYSIGTHENNNSKMLKNRIILEIQNQNSNRQVNGIMVQLPLPKIIKEYTQEILDSIGINKDVDGLTSHSLGLLSMGKPKFISSTPKGAISLIDHYKIPLRGKVITIIGNSSLVGIPLTLLLTQREATVTVCHIDTVDTRKHCARADMIFTCCGVGHMIKKNWVKEGSIVVDIGITVKENPFSQKKLVIGDCDFEDIKDKVKYITPVPGGIGPVTIYTLLEQLVESAENKV
jgi:methylenetetrahydrofolate dehydrogenase (NADP+) / methenyltetrahydrofolate cyclohydrolase